MKNIKKILSAPTAGFTLIEVLVVVLIIGVLAAIAVPQYQNAVERSRAVEAISVLDEVYKAETLYQLEYGFFTDDLADLSISAVKED